MEAPAPDKKIVFDNPIHLPQLQEDFQLHSGHRLTSFWTPALHNVFHRTYRGLGLFPLPVLSVLSVSVIHFGHSSPSFWTPVCRIFESTEKSAKTGMYCQIPNFTLFSPVSTVPASGLPHFGHRASSFWTAVCRIFESTGKSVKTGMHSPVHHFPFFSPAFAGPVSGLPHFGHCVPFPHSRETHIYSFQITFR